MRYKLVFSAHYGQNQAEQRIYLALKVPSFEDTTSRFPAKKDKTLPAL